MSSSAAGLALLGALLMLGLLAATATAAKIPLTSAEGFPNGRTSNDPPALAIDGNTGTATWTTETLNTTSPAYLAVGFAATTATRIRVFKSAEGGGGPNVKNLVIQYTVGSGPLASRAWSNVRNLRSGFNGAEPFQAVSVNPSGTVEQDTQDVTAFASLSFDPVVATGIRIGFSVPFTGGSCSSNPSGPCNHYRVYEFEVWDDAPPVPAPAEPVRGQPPIVGPPLYRVIFGRASARMAADASDRELQAGWVLGQGDRLRVENYLNIGDRPTLRIQSLATGAVYDISGNTVRGVDGQYVAFDADVVLGASYNTINAGRIVMKTGAGAGLNARALQRRLATLLTPVARIDGSDGTAVIEHDPQRRVTTVTNEAGRVRVTPANRRLRGLQLVPGQRVRVTPDTFSLTPGGDPASADLARTIPSPRVTRNGPVAVTNPAALSLRALRRSKCVRTAVVSARPARVLVTIFSGRRSVRLFGQKLVRFTRPGSKVACIRVPARAKTFNVRTPLRFAVGYALGATARRGARLPAPVIRPIRLIP